MKHRLYSLIILALLFLLAAQALAAERVPVVDVVIVPGQTAVIICDGAEAELVTVDDLTFMVDCIR